jgi:hypothetical protein
MRGFFTSRSLAGVAVVFLTALANGQESRSNGGEPKPSNPKMAATDTLMRLLDHEIHTKGLPDAFFPLLDHLTTKMRSTGRDLTFYVDVKLFSKDVQAVIDGELPPPRFKLQPLPERMTIRAILQNAVSQFDGEEATFLIRQGRVEITTKKAAALPSLLKQTFAASFDRQPLEMVLDDISDLTGVSVVIDGRAKEKMRTAITARFRNDVPLLEALQMVTESAELKLVEISGSSGSPRALFVTTPEHAQVLRR